MDRDQSVKLNTTLTSIKTALEGIKSALDTIALNTTPADSAESAQTQNRSGSSK